MADDRALIRADFTRQTQQAIIDIRDRAVRRVAGLWAERADPDYNPDGELPRSKVPFRTAIAAEYVGHIVRSQSEAAALSAVIRELTIPEKEPVRDFADAVVVERRRGDD